MKSQKLYPVLTLVTALSLTSVSAQFSGGGGNESMELQAIETQPGSERCDDPSVLQVVEMIVHSGVSARHGDQQEFRHGARMDDFQSASESGSTYVSCGGYRPAAF
jgi:hypothetical protein